MPVSKEYVEYVLDQLSCLGPIAHKRMFGGVGLYFDGLFFGLIDDDIVYFKVDDITRRRYEAARTKPFQPGGEGPSQSLGERGRRGGAAQSLEQEGAKRETKMIPAFGG